jgi:thiol-disulfide isomerase/thioredoxin
MAKIPNPALLTVILSAAAGLGYFGFRVLTAGDSAAPEAPTPAPAALEAPPQRSLVASLPDFSLQNLSGDDVPISTWAGKPMLLNFWATWCGPCRKEIPMLKDFQSQHPAWQVVGIAIDREPAVQSYAKDMQFNYPILVGETAAMNAAATLGVDVIALPFSIFVGANGQVLGMHTGELHPEHLDNLDAVLTDLGTGTIDADAARARLAGKM